MTTIRQVKTNFTAGEISPELLGRGDLRQYANGALRLRNLFIYPTGGITRRAGLRYIDTADGDGRLVSFEFNTEQTYLLVFTDLKVQIFSNGLSVTTLVTPWTLLQLRQLVWTQSADTLLLVHPDVPPKKLVRLAGGTFALQDWAFFTENNIIHQPYYKFAPTAMTITPSAVSGTITVTTSAPFFIAAHAQTRFRIGGKEVLITTINSPTIATANVLQPLANTNPTIDWGEAAFSSARGYPQTIAFHQDRLVIGGSRDLPNRLWFSKSGDLFNFDLGTGLDDDGIEFAILSDQVNAIRGIFSGRHLQVFTSGAEWMVTGDPLTPQTVQLNRQTRIGSRVDRYIPPVTVDGATLFAGRNGQQLCEFMYTDIEQAYQAADTALVARHVLGKPVDQDFDAARRLLFVVREDGKFATHTMYRMEQVAAWTLHETMGNVRAVCVVAEDVYILVERFGSYFIEVFEDDLNLDSALTGEVTVPTATWSGLSHLNGKTVSVVADDKVVAPVVVVNGAITLSQPVKRVKIGLPYTHIVEPLPPAMTDDGLMIRKIRLVEALFRVRNTQSLKVNMGRGLRDVALRQLSEDTILDSPPPIVSGDISVRALGWKHDTATPLWRIEQDTPLPFTVLSVITEVNVNDP